MHLLCEVVIVIRLAVKEIEFGVFPKAAVKCDAVSKSQHNHCYLRSFHVMTSKPTGRALESLWKKRLRWTERSKGHRYETKPAT